VLGNKCTGRHNFKTVYFKEALVSGYFWHVHQQYVLIFKVLYPPGTAAASSSVAMVEVTPYKLFLKVPGVNKQLASSDFTLRKR
jgi:hypothetical protein